MSGTEMKCPSCNQSLARHKYHKLVVDTCQNCNGIWFVSGERMRECLTFLRKERSDIPFARIDLNKEVMMPANKPEASKLCPRCAGPMREVNYAYDSNIFLDKCPSCGGIWADGGEVYKLATHAKGNPRLDSLARSIVDDRKREEEIRELGRLGDDLTENVGVGWVFLPKIILPLGDESEVSTFPWAVLGIILANILVFLYMSFRVEDLSSFVREYGLISSEILSGRGYFPFISSMFLHAGLLHLAANMFFFWIFGPNVEGSLGHVRFILLYFLFGFCASLLHIFVNAHSILPAIGSSGAIAGTMGAYFTLHPHARIRTLIIDHVVSVPAYIYLGGWISLQVVFGIIYLSQGVEGGIGWFAHIGGFVSGLLLAWPCRKPTSPKRAIQESGR